VHTVTASDRRLRRVVGAATSRIRWSDGNPPARPSRRRGDLTGTQLGIVELIALGRTDKEIAATLRIAYRTVRTHLERLYERNDVHSRAALVAVVAWRRQLYPVSDADVISTTRPSRAAVFE
jgi:DNA-binding CsgD family transcriptional regulator